MSGVVSRLLVCAALIGSTAGVAAGADRALALRDAITMALEKNEGLIVAREELSAAQAGEDGARGAYDPRLGLQLGWMRTTQAANSVFSGAPAGEVAPTDTSGELGLGLRQLLPTGGEVRFRAAAARQSTDGSSALLSPAHRSQLGLEIRQPLLRNLATDPARLGLSVASADRARADSNLVLVTSETVAAVERAYWRLVAAAGEVTVREEAVRLADEQLTQTRLRIESGSTPETEIAQPRAELERRRGELLASREGVTRAENVLKLLILADGDGSLWSDHLLPAADATVDLVPVDIESAMERALGSRPELDVAARVVERRRAEAAFARDAVKPMLDLVASYDRYGLAGQRNPAVGDVSGFPVEVPARLEGGWRRSIGVLGDGDFEDARVALVLDVPIGNRTARAEAVVASSAERQAEVDLAAARKTIRAEVLDAGAALETASQRIEAARAAREAAEVQLAAERDRYDVGLSINFLVLTRQNDLSRARLDEISALTDYRMARTELARATGSLLGERGVVVKSGTEATRSGKTDGGAR
jgi:outer membrane protein TolC